MIELYLRKAEYSDIKLLFDWANDPVVRQNSFNNNPISYEKHQIWFDAMMKDQDVIQFILMQEEIPIGQIRLTVHNDEAEIGYSIAAQYRGKGYGRIILILVKDTVIKHYPQIKKLIAKVKPDNGASNNLFQGEGYNMEYCCYSLQV